ncbi:MAG: hypothetical protein FWD75_03335 [Propionibacteriaceae bacterium]|nr:hypothetical protein [Propionibacteriaceae bacterium]
MTSRDHAGRRGARRRRVLTALLVVLLPSALAGCGVQATTTGDHHDGYCTASDDRAVTVVIDYADLGPAPFIGCAHNLPDHATGRDALAALGISVTEVARTPQFICRIDGYPRPGQPVPIPGKPSYTEACVDTPPTAAYWTYWTAADQGGWTYSIQGYALHQVAIGGFEGYSFAHDTLPADSAPSVAPVRP